VGTLIVGGLCQVGYVPNRDIILVGSADKATLTDTLTGERLDEEVPIPLEPSRQLIAPGFGVAAGEMVPMAGIWGGGLRRMTADGFYLTLNVSGKPVLEVTLQYPNDRREISVCTDSASEIYAYGFSDTGDSFVIASACDLRIFARRS